MSGDGAGASGVIGPMDVLAFWRTAGPDQWFEKDPDFDAEIATRFAGLYRAAVAGELDLWEDTPEGALALVIVLDQFPRNMFRGEPRMYDADARARAVAARAMARGFDRQIAPLERRFCYLPLMHSEDLADQERCLALAADYGDDEFARHAANHADIVRRFGRFPHRNAVLGRITSAEEQAFLDGGGFTG
ncbi:MAG TPA: DUF924 family protein [Xanthobacteraceae bacterium]|jgi:uncharacterized protein (DUF924 family)